MEKKNGGRETKKNNQKKYVNTKKKKTTNIHNNLRIKKTKTKQQLHLKQLISLPPLKVKF